MSQVDLENLSDEDAIALALEMCPEGESIELHEPYCDVLSCTCIPRVITKRVAAA